MTHANLTRRQLLRASLGLAAGLMVAPKCAFAIASREVREIGLHNVHTGDAGRFVYYENGRYVPQALAALNHLLRDFRTEDVHAMDTMLLDMLYLLQAQTQSNRAYEVISGFRSAKTNAMLHASTEGVNPRSLHMEGRAIDIRLPGAKLDWLADRASEMQLGGVGLYQKSGFVHLDTGSITRW
jgi:uncharacterized protein YcbK (DUF882 family)